jgi:hypothetical protein
MQGLIGCWSKTEDWEWEEEAWDLNIPRHDTVPSSIIAYVAPLRALIPLADNPTWVANFDTGKAFLGLNLDCASPHNAKPCWAQVESRWNHSWTVMLKLPGFLCLSIRNMEKSYNVDV